MSSKAKVKAARTYALNKGFGGKKNNDTTDSKIANLRKIPAKEERREVPKITSFGANLRHQADLLELPKDQGQKFALVVVDAGTRLTDAIPLPNKSADTVRVGFEKIYDTFKGQNAKGVKGKNHIILDVPARIDVDDGSEFKGSVAKYFQEQNIFVNRSKWPARHRHVGLVENRNKLISEMLFAGQYVNEDEEGGESGEWVDDLRDVLDEMNGKLGRDPYKKRIPKKLIVTKGNQDLIPIGTKVRSSLNRPENLDGKPYPGIQRFRATDIRFRPAPRTVIDIITAPGYPPMYLLDNPTDHVKYTKQQLQVVPDNER